VGSPPSTAVKVVFPHCTIIIVNDSLMTYLRLLTDDLSNPWYTHIHVDNYFKKWISVSIAYRTIFQYRSISRKMCKNKNDK
jgi:hypothetical protein